MFQDSANSKVVGYGRGNVSEPGAYVEGSEAGEAWTAEGFTTDPLFGGFDWASTSWLDDPDSLDSSVHGWSVDAGASVLVHHHEPAEMGDVRASELSGAEVPRFGRRMPEAVGEGSSSRSGVVGYVLPDQHISRVSRKQDQAPKAKAVSDRGSKARRWVFTLNGYAESDVERLRLGGDAGGGVVYLCGQREIGDSGNRHIQGLVCFRDPVWLTGVRKFLPGAHFEVMRGTLQQAEAYCTKEETRDPEGSVFRYGVRPPEQGARKDLAEIGDLVKRGASETEIFETDPGMYLRYHGGIKRALTLYQGARDFKTEVFWYFGGTGSGKSRACAAEAPDAYWKAPTDYWWCGYNADEVVVIDDYRCDFCKFSELLRLFDRYPLRLQIKGGHCQFMAKRIYVTAPFHPVKMWATRSAEDMQQLVRRLTCVKEFKIDCEPVIVDNNLVIPPILFNPPVTNR